MPFKYKNIIPNEKYLLQNKNPPKVRIEFYDDIKNLKSLNCYSNEGNKWRQSNIKFENDTTLLINIAEKFVREKEVELIVLSETVVVSGDGWVFNLLLVIR